MSDNKTTSGGAGFASLLGIAFIVLKLTKVINWPWIWVLSPLWIPIAAVLFILLCYGIYLWRKEAKARKRFNKRYNTIITRGKEVESIDDHYKSKWQTRMEEMKLNRKK